MKKGLATCVVIVCACAAIYGLVFEYYHPHFPITLPDATACKVYGIEYYRKILYDQLSRGVKTPVLPPPFYGDRVITNGPIVCSSDVLAKAQRLICSQSTYQRSDGLEPGGRFDPSYAYKLTGPSGSVIVLLGGGVDIAKFDLHGNLVADSGVTGGSGGQWAQLLRETLPSDKVVATWCTKYKASERTQNVWQRLGERIGIPLGQ
jgi:hypothetical protein